MSSAAAVNRRDFLAAWLGRTRPEPAARSVSPAAQPRAMVRTAPVPPTVVGAPAAPPVARVAIVQGRHCLAYQRSFCSTCIERCPIPGGIIRHQGLPMVDPSVCDGCGLCQAACPAPRNAILMLPRRPGT